MWIFTSNSFLSVVEHDLDSGLLHVRARFAGDIEEVFPGADVIETPSADYRYRTSLPREKVADAMARLTREIDYDNFKNSVSDPARRDDYIKVWEVMWRAQRARTP